MKIERVKSNLISSELIECISQYSERQWLKYNKPIAKYVSIEASIMFGYIINQYELSLKMNKGRLIKGDYWLPIRYEFVEKNTFLTPIKQKRAVEELFREGILSIEYREGKRKWVKVNFNIWKEKLTLWVSQMMDEYTYGVDVIDSDINQVNEEIGSYI